MLIILDPETWPVKDGTPEQAMGKFHAFNQMILEVGSSGATRMFSACCSC